MKKYAYLARLEELLEALPAQERQDALRYYEEFFDAADAGESEQAGLESPEDAARKILEGEGMALQENAEEAPGPRLILEPPTAPEPPAAPGPEPEQTPWPGAGPRVPKGFTQRSWRVFRFIIAAALGIQLVLILLFAADRIALGEPSAYTETAVSSVSMVERVLPADTCETANNGTVQIDLVAGTVLFVTDPDADEVAVSASSGAQTDCVLTREGNDWSVSCSTATDDLKVTVTLPITDGEVRPLDSVVVQVGTGQIWLGSLDAGCVEATVAEGSIRGGNIRAQEVRMYAGNGNIYVDALLDPVNVTLESPCQHIQAGFSGESSDYWLSARSSHGQVDLGENGFGGSISGGSSHAEAVINAEAYGNITLKFGKA